MAEGVKKSGAEAPELVPDTILHLVQNNGFLSDPEALIRLRLLSKTWNYTLRQFAGSESLVTNLCEKNLSSFSQFLSSDASLKLQETNIRSVNLSLRSQYEHVYTKTLREFTQLPGFFRSKLHRFKLNSALQFPPNFKLFWNFLRKAELDSLEELDMVVETSLFFIPAFAMLPPNESFHGLRFEFLQKLTVPLHLSLHLLKTCSILKHVTLHVFDVELPSYFWDCLKDVVLLNGLNQSLEELFFDDRCGIHWQSEVDVRFCFVSLFECNFRLKKLGFGLHFDCEREEGFKEEFLKFLVQQSETLTYLQLPSLANAIDYCDSQGGYSDTFISDVAYFPNMKELKFEQFIERSGRLFGRCPGLEKVILPSVLNNSDREGEDFFEDDCISLSTKSVVVHNVDEAFSSAFYHLFPSMESLEINGTISTHSILEFCLTLTTLKRLSIKVEFNFMEERNLGWMLESYFGEEGYYERIALERRVKADCFLLRVLPKDFKRYQSGRVPCNSATTFPPVSDYACITQLRELEYLSLQGHFTELIIWAGIKPLTQLQEFHLKTQHLIHPSTMFDLESHLSKLRSWSYTKLAKTENGFREIYKCFRTSLKAVGPDQFHVWKFNDNNKKEKKVVTLAEFDSLDLSYTGTQDTLVPDDDDVDSTSDSDGNSDTEEEDSDSEPMEFDDEENDDEDEFV